MHMVTHKQQKPNVSKPAGRKFAAHKAGKGRKIARAAGRVFLGLLGIGTPLLLNAQAKDAQLPINPAQEKVIYVASADRGLPAGTYVAPVTDGKDTLQNLAMNERTKDAKKIEPGPDPNQKWCDGIAIENGKLIFKGVSAHGKRGDAILPFADFLEMFGISDATTENIKWEKIVTIAGAKKAFFVVETETKSVLITSNPDFENADSTWGKAIFSKDGSRIFTHERATLINDDGTVLATTPTTLLFIRGGERGLKFEMVYNKLLGNGPDLTNPTIERYKSDRDIINELLILPEQKEQANDLIKNNEYEKLYKLLKKNKVYEKFVELTSLIRINDYTMPDQYILLSLKTLGMGVFDKKAIQFGLNK